MNRTILLTTLVILSQACFTQKSPSVIDTINSATNIEKIINSRINDKYEKFTLTTLQEFKGRYGPNEFCKTIADSLNITRSFYKADLDNNGYTDLLAIGKFYDFMIFIVMNFGNDSLKLFNLTRRNFQNCTFPQIIDDTVLRYYSISEQERNLYGPNSKTKGFSLQKKDLVFKFKNFIELNQDQMTYDIQKIEYQTSFCYGSCPKFSIVINKDRTAFFNAERYNYLKNDRKDIQGRFTTILKENSFLEITSLLNYIDFPKLEDSYAVSWTDDQSCTLKITYNNGLIKEIHDYGLIGTYGLDRLYQMLFDLRFNQEWK